MTLQDEVTECLEFINKHLAHDCKCVGVKEELDKWFK